MFFQMFLDAIAVLYDYPGGGILSSCFCMITCSLYGKTFFFKCNIAESCQIIIFFSNKSGAIIDFWSLSFFFFLFYIFNFLLNPVVGLVKPSSTDVKQKWFLKEIITRARWSLRKNLRQGNRKLCAGKSFFPNQFFETFTNMFCFVFLMVGWRSCDGTYNCNFKCIFHISLFTTFTYTLCTK